MKKVILMILILPKLTLLFGFDSKYIAPASEVNLTYSQNKSNVSLGALPKI